MKIKSIYYKNIDTGLVIDNITFGDGLNLLDR